MDDDSKLEKLINQSKSNDVDLKIDAITKLQLEFEKGTEINDPDALINVFKTCLRTSNQHLTTATITALPSLLHLLISPPINPSDGQSSASLSSSTSSSMVNAVTLRQVLNAFLPTGGVVDRLGDSRERTREKAREILVILGGFAYRSGAAGSTSSKSKEPKGPETPLMIFERFIKEGGLGSKVWKTREQAILTLVHIRRTHTLFPLRPYLSQLVSALEDGDAHVRECARPSVIELFTGPGVTDAARADLKKEMAKKGVRKTIVDGVLSKLVPANGANSPGGSNPPSDGSENGDAANRAASKSTGYLPPSLALQVRKEPVPGPSGPSRVTSAGNTSRPASRAALVEPATPLADNADVKPVYIASSRDMEAEFAAMLKPFEGKETEHNWMAREAAILLVRGMLKGDAYLRYADTFLGCLKEGFIQWSLKALASLRTTLTVNTTSLYSELAVALGPSLDPFCDTLLTSLLKMAGFTKKIAAQQAQASVTAILTHTSANPRICLPLLWNTLQEKTIQARSFVINHLKTYLELHGHRWKNLIESSGGLQILEKSLKKSLVDPNPAVKEAARSCFWIFESVWQERGRAILDTLDSVARKQLEKTCPHPETAARLPTTTTAKTSRKSSVAAAIAASRAKAKVIATTPPTLRHQATSTSQVARTTSPPTKSVVLPLSPRGVVRSLSPVPRSPASPTSPKSRASSNTSPRPVSMSGGSSTSSRSPPSSVRAQSPPRVATEPSTFRPRASSPLAVSSKTMLRRPAVGLSPTTKTPAASRNSVGRTVAVPVPPREPKQDEEEWLGSTVMPTSGDSDSEGSTNLLSFSAAFETDQPPLLLRKLDSPAASLSPKSDPIVAGGQPSPSNAPSSTGPVREGPPSAVVEDALRARAEQAESAAERLLELVEPEADLHLPSSIPASLLAGSGVGDESHPSQHNRPRPAPLPTMTIMTPPMTPVNKNVAIMKQAAMFKDSPAYKRSSSSLLDGLKNQKHETGWWLKRMKMVEGRAPAYSTEGTSPEQDLVGYITALEQDQADIGVLQKISMCCIEYPTSELVSPPLSPIYPTSPSPFLERSRSSASLKPDLWTKDKNFERLFKGLMKFLDPTKNEDEIEYGLIILWEMLENQAPYIENREGEIFSMLLTVRYCNKLNVLEATNTIRDALTARVEPVYGLTTLHASLRAFNENAGGARPESSSCSDAVKAATYAFGLSGLGKFFLRLPAEILEDELPRLKTTLISALNNQSSLVVRESAAASIIAAQLVMRDETHLFMLLDGLADEKKNLLAYLFDKHGARGSTGLVSASSGSSGMDKLQKEMRRLDTRTSTPPRTEQHGGVPDG